MTLSPAFSRGLGRAFLGRGREARARAAFESSLADRCGGGAAVAVDSGRNALAAVLRALAPCPGAEVILPDYTLDSLALIVRELGLVPVPVDVSAHDYNLDPQRAEEAITARTVAIVATHLFGRPCDLDALADIAARRGLALVEDAAHALGAEYRGRPVGGAGRAACLSFASIKPVHALGGGAVVTRDAELASAIRGGLRHQVSGADLARTALATLAEELAGHPRLFGLVAGPLLHRPGLARTVQRVYRKAKRSGDPPAPRRMAAFQAALGREQVAALAADAAARARVAAVYRERLEGRVHLQQARHGDRPVHYAEVVRLDRPAGPVARALYRRGVDAGTGTSVMQSCSAALGLETPQNSAALLERALELPQSARMSEDDAHRVCDALLAVLG